MLVSALVVYNYGVLVRGVVVVVAAREMVSHGCVGYQSTSTSTHN